MSKPKSVKIKLTDRQKEQIRTLTGEEHDEVRFEAVPPGHAEMATKSTLAKRTAMRTLRTRVVARSLSGRTAARSLSGRSVGRKTLRIE